MMAGRPPECCGLLHIRPPELMFVQYLPVKMPGVSGFRVPPGLTCFQPLLDRIYCDPGQFVYLTAKHLFVPAGGVANRPGWHCDGFGTEDVNYLWYDSVPTEFCIQPFDLCSDDQASMRQMDEEVRVENIKTYGSDLLLRLDQSVVHRPAVNDVDRFRVFAKISVSRDLYDLAGNAHNYLFDYHWPMRQRALSRNNPVETAI